MKIQTLEKIIVFGLGNSRVPFDLSGFLFGIQGI